MYHNCVFSMWFVGWAGLEPARAFTVCTVAAFTFGSFLSITLKSGLIPDDFHYLPPAALPQACQLHHLPKALMWGTYQINFNSSGFFQSCIRAAHDPYQKFNPITKEACFHRLVYSLTLSLKGLSLTGYLCEFVCTSGYLPPLMVFTEVFCMLYFCKCNSIAYLEFTTYVSFWTIR
jgi:hypothetical protein